MFNIILKKRSFKMNKLKRLKVETHQFLFLLNEKDIFLIIKKNLEMGKNSTRGRRQNS